MNWIDVEFVLVFFAAMLSPLGALVTTLAIGVAAAFRARERRRLPQQIHPEDVGCDRRRLAVRSAHEVISQPVCLGSARDRERM
jgi:hypothetical protein